MTSDPSPLPPRQATTNASPGHAPSAAPAVAFEQLAQGGREVLIHHAGQVYRLRATKNHKLILNK